MRRPFHPRSRSFRAVLGMALLAWAVLASGALAGPLRMFDVTSATITMQMVQPQTANADCDGMTTTLGSHPSHPAPMPPAGNGHGCCHNGGCYCASVCSGIVGVPAFRMTWQPAHDAALSLIHSGPTPVHSAPPLRPPIA